VSSIDNILAALHAARRVLEQAATDAREAAGQAGQIRDVGRATGVRSVVERFERLRARIEQVGAMLATGIDLTEEAISRAEATADARGTHSAPTASGEAIGTAGALPTADESGTTPDDKVQAGAPRATIDEVLAVLPVRVNDEGPTWGHLIDDEGRPAGAAIGSSRDARLFDGLDLPWRARRSEAMFSHVEPKVAAMMRHGKAPRHAVLLINNEYGPCGWQDQQNGEPPVGTNCHELLSDVIPAGSSLTVRWRGSDGVERSEIYRGTGRGIRS
jgi:hypothetical protein